MCLRAQADRLAGALVAMDRPLSVMLARLARGLQAG